MKKNGLERIKKLSDKEISPVEQDACLEILKSRRVAIFIVAYNAERHLQSLVERIPRQLLPLFAEIFVIDDSSSDFTYDVASRMKSDYAGCNITVYRTPFNRGYGGNQKLGYLYSIEKGHEIVVLLHGDGQYAPEYIPRVLAGFQDEPDAVFASRMLQKNMAREGGMPFYKWIGNQILTSLENRLLGLHLSEFHTGFRAYSVPALARIPFVFNSDDFHFDTEIIIQAVASKWKIKEVAVPTYYGDEQCHVNGMKYAHNCIKAVLSYHLVNLGLFYKRNYDFGLFESERYQFKKSEHSLHQYVINNCEFRPDMVTLELGANHGILSSEIAAKVKRHVAVDSFVPDLAGGSVTKAVDLNTKFSQVLPAKSFDSCIALDVIEHLDEPESFLSEVVDLLKVNAKLYLSTANICYLPLRFSVLLGEFNYGKRGILDRTHKRLFSVASFRKTITQYGFKIDLVRGFPPPLSDLISNRWWMRLLERFHAFLSNLLPNLFAYNFLIVATRMDGISDIFEMTVHTEQYKQLQEERQKQAHHDFFQRSAGEKNP